MVFIIVPPSLLRRASQPHPSPHCQRSPNFTVRRDRRRSHPL